MLGDGECSEGSVWEAMAFGSHYQLDNLVAILDVNRLGQSEPAPLKHDMEIYRKRCEAFGSARHLSRLITCRNKLSELDLIFVFPCICSLMVYRHVQMLITFYVCRWNTYVVDGHDVEELCKAFWQAQQVKGKPTCIVAKTFKGRGLKGWCEQLFLCLFTVSS